MNTFDFRPHSGEAGDIDHLASTFMNAGERTAASKLKLAFSF